jgi:hypothetical protein
MWHLLIDIGGGAALLALGFILGGTAAFYKGRDEGFSEVHNIETKEGCKNWGVPRG